MIASNLDLRRPGITRRTVAVVTTLIMVVGGLGLVAISKMREAAILRM